MAKSPETIQINDLKGELQDLSDNLSQMLLQGQRFFHLKSKVIIFIQHLGDIASQDDQIWGIQFVERIFRSGE